MNSYFIERRHCPCCQSLRGKELCCIPYTQSPLRDYLLSFYSPQGKVEFEYLKEQNYYLIQCINCGLIYQREIPCQFLMHKLYEEWIDPQKVFDLVEKKRSIGYFSRLSAEIMSIIRMFDSPTMQLKFLDFSMGWGHWCKMAQAFRCEVHGTEFSSARIAYAKQQGVHVVEYENLPNSYYDFINANQVFEHLPNPMQTLSHLSKKLAQGGILKISVPYAEDIINRLDKWDWYAPKGSADSLNPVAPLEHINCFSRALLIHLAKAHQLVPISIHQVTYQLQPDSFKEIVKACLRPIWYQLRGHQKLESTCIFFQATSK